LRVKAQACQRYPVSLRRFFHPLRWRVNLFQMYVPSLRSFMPALRGSFPSLRRFFHPLRWHVNLLKRSFPSLRSSFQTPVNYFVMDENVVWIVEQQ
jgi:hypothetical protein